MRRAFELGRGEVESQEFPVMGGFAFFRVDEIQDPDSMDRSSIESRLREAEQGLESAEEDSEEYRRCERNVRRYRAFLEVAEGA
jgi:F0F1-type ATP synthase epsilon subunit